MYAPINTYCKLETFCLIGDISDFLAIDSYKKKAMNNLSIFNISK